jgi:hypothetical protein
VRRALGQTVLQSLPGLGKGLSFAARPDTQQGPQLCISWVAQDAGRTQERRNGAVESAPGCANAKSSVCLRGKLGLPEASKLVDIRTPVQFNKLKQMPLLSPPILTKRSLHYLVLKLLFLRKTCTRCR